MKKCFALLLTLLLALGLTATAFAVEGETPTRPSITVDGQTYELMLEKFENTHVNAQVVSSTRSGGRSLRCRRRAKPWIEASGVLNSWVTPPIKSRCRSAVSVSSSMRCSTAPAMALKSRASAPTSSAEDTATRSA